MRKAITLTILLVLVMLLYGCAGSPTSRPIILASQTDTLPSTVESQPSLIVLTPTPSEGTNGTQTVEESTTTPAIPKTVGNLPDISDAVYLDDRSTPAAVMLSYFNAINRHEYLRAYSYYANTTDLGNLEQFSNGYSETQSVDVVLGQNFSEGAAGSIYYTVPMVLNATTTGNNQQKFAACYVLRLSQPANYGAPPITPMHIDRGTAQSIPLTTSDEEALGMACHSADFPTGMNAATAAVERLDDVSAANYIDNRSDPVAVLSSYLNAINKKEYVRAYSYWQTPPEPYETFAAGFNTTAEVSAQFGSLISDPGAGQLNYALPVVIKSKLTNGDEQTYAGCYYLHLSQPSFQATPPFVPLGISRANVQQVQNDADPDLLLQSACQ